MPMPPVVRRRQAPSPAHQRVLAPAARPARALSRRALSRPVLRLVAAAMVTMVVVGGLSYLGQAREAGLPTHTAVARVGAGETVWDVAARVAPRSDQRAVVERILQLNGLVGSAVNPDQQLQVPAGR
ncbi:MAG: LysM peptidoglycan-binding domain-containing protein [Pseudonocardiaceae bacterium]